MSAPLTVGQRLDELLTQIHQGAGSLPHSIPAGIRLRLNLRRLKNWLLAERRFYPLAAAWLAWELACLSPWS